MRIPDSTGNPQAGRPANPQSAQDAERLRKQADALDSEIRALRSQRGRSRDPKKIDNEIKKKQRQLGAVNRALAASAFALAF